MKKEEKQLQVFIEKAQKIAEDWIRAEIDGETTHPHYANKLYLLMCTAKEVMNAKEDTDTVND